MVVTAEVNMASEGQTRRLTLHLVFTTVVYYEIRLIYHECGKKLSVTLTKFESLIILSRVQNVQSGGYGVFILLCTTFQAFRTYETYFPNSLYMKIKKSVKRVLLIWHFLSYIY